MAVKKWPKWAAGITGVLSFTGFLYMTQSHQTTGAANTADAAAADSLPLPTEDAAPLVPVSKEEKVAAPKAGSAIQTFVHSRTEFLKVENLPAEVKKQRELQLEQLNWDSSGSTAAQTATIQVAAPTPVKTAVKPPAANKQQAAVSTPAPTPPPVKSNRVTRRS